MNTWRVIECGCSGFRSKGAAKEHEQIMRKDRNKYHPCGIAQRKRKR